MSNNITRILVLGIAALMALMPAPAKAQIKPFGKPLATCVARAQGQGETPRQVLANPARFSCAADQTLFGPGDFWVATPRLNLVFDTGDPLRVRIASLWQHRMTLYALHADGTTTIFPPGRNALAGTLKLGAMVEYAFPVHMAPVTRLVWHVEGSQNLRGVVIGARAGTAAEGVRADLTMATIYSAFSGLCIALLVYNLALWGALRHRFQLAYCAMVAALLVYTMSSSGVLAWHLPDLANADRLRTNYGTLAIAAAAALYFARTFFEPRVFGRNLGLLIRVIGFVVLGGGAAMVLAPDRWIPLADRLYAIAFLTVPLAVLPVLWSAWVARSRYLWLFAVAWAAPAYMAFVRALHSLGWGSWSFWLDNSTIIAMTAEALLSSLAIAYRIRLLSLERDLAIAQETESRKLAQTDDLTGLLNRRAFLLEAIGRSGRQQLILADLDHFKRVNDTLGHDGGDEVLRVFARSLRLAVPIGALVARFGGEEFAIVVNGDSQIDPNALLATLRTARMPFDLRVTASLGVCTGPLATEQDWKRMYQCADRALFEAKAHGRDRARHGERLVTAG
ncbi:sensor domain-containing diguanylate cyclase [Sphingomonas sp. 37zxx]|uniref:sensor domain-containing diguanylate cyclase n=1 Tax=Sphingomonas sp. 37zxx TaxID=1550073 RepID=UPI001E46CAA2|nr:diguanylate cyclase [Sphingomonas sp. 37zxx]